MLVEIHIMANKYRFFCCFFFVFCRFRFFIFLKKMAITLVTRRVAPRRLKTLRLRISPTIAPKSESNRLSDTRADKMRERGDQFTKAPFDRPLIAICLHYCYYEVVHYNKPQLQWIWERFSSQLSVVLFCLCVCLFVCFIIFVTICIFA